MITPLPARREEGSGDGTVTLGLSTRRPSHLRRPAQALVFEIEEFAVHDGPGIRTTVFFKGCPLHCTWCHNPESISFEPEVMLKRAICPTCGGALDVHEGCCPKCATPIDRGSLRLGEVMGAPYTAQQLADLLVVHQSILRSSGGGITFSGGEPLVHRTFLTELIPLLQHLHVAVETSGHATPTVFRSVVDLVDLVMLDVKHTDSRVHRRFTGVGNERILANLLSLCRGDTDFVVRIPLVPGVNDSTENMEGTAELLRDAPHLQRVELLPYNMMAPAKYARLGRRYLPGFDPGQAPKVHTRPFERHGIPCEVL